MMISAPTVPFFSIETAHPQLTAAVRGRWSDIVGSAAFIGGAHLDAFESAWATYCDTRHAVGVGNGTDAIHLALRALGVGRGDEVLVPANTFVASVEAVVLSGATPRFVDVGSHSLLLTPEGLTAAITPRTAAVVAVHLYGNVCDLDGIMRVARRHGIAVLEDAAQAHGARWRGRHVGSFGDAGCFSFYPGKTLGAFGDGGAVVSNDSGLIERIRSISNHGRTQSSRYEHDVVGTNSRLDALQAAVLHAKLPYLAGWVRSRRRIVERCRDALHGTNASVPATATGAQPAWHLNVIRVPERDAVRQSLAAHNIGTGVHYPIPCHLQPAYQRYGEQPMPVAESAAAEVISLPLFPQMHDDQVEAVCQSLRSALRGAQS